MDQPSTSGNKDGFTSSPATVSPGQKQKSRTLEIPNVTPSEIRKNANEQSGQIQSAPSSRDQNLAQGVVSSQLTNEDPLACFRSQTDEPETVSSSIDVAFDPKEIKERIKQERVKIEELERNLKAFKENTEALNKHIQNNVRVREELVKQLNIHENSKTLVKDELVDVGNEFVGRQEEERLTPIHNDAILALHQRRKDLTERIEAEISKYRVLVACHEAHMRELSLLGAKRTLIKNELIVDGNKLCVMLKRNQQWYSEEIGEIDRIIENIEAELDVLTDEDVKRKLQLLVECEALRVPKLQRQD